MAGLKLWQRHCGKSCDYSSFRVCPFSTILFRKIDLLPLFEKPKSYWKVKKLLLGSLVYMAEKAAYETDIALFIWSNSLADLTKS